MSIEPGSKIETVIEDMIRKGYIKITDNRIFSNKPMRSMAQLFDHIFPRMPGLNLVAYLGQMIDEVTAGRKSQAEASIQFNQMLGIQGVSISEAATPKTAKKKFSYLRTGDESSSEKKVRRPIVMPGKPANIFSQLKTGTVIKTLSMVKGDIPSAVKEVKEDVADTSVEPRVTRNNIPAETYDSQKRIDAVSETEAAKERHDVEIHKIKIQQESGSDEFEPADDREIEDRILEFEEQLGLKCPLCRTGGIKTSETAKGKTYYHCLNTECNFISRGKPYYFECPKCERDFLIEINDSSGRNFLKCPWDESNQAPGYSGSAADSNGAIKKPVRKVRRRVAGRKKPG